MNAVFLNFQSFSFFLMNSTLASNHAEYLSVNQSFNSDILTNFYGNNVGDRHDTR
jgi:hypothetical protein